VDFTAKAEDALARKGDVGDVFSLLGGLSAPAKVLF